MPNSGDVMKTCKWIKGLAAVLGLVCAQAASAGDAVRIFAAASLQGPLDAAAASWETDTVISYGGSGTLARQISLGAPVDVVVLANATWADWLVDNGHAPGPVRDLLSNRLVLIGPAGAAALPDPKAAMLLARLDGGRMAMGQHMSVPAGIYARAWLESIDAWDDMRPHLAETENVRAALALVARGEVPLGVVYRSDAMASAAVSILWTMPDDQHPPIRYPGLALTPDGAAFLDHLATQTDAFLPVGFEALP